MATAAAAAKGGPKEITFLWEGKDRAGKSVRGEMRAAGENMVNAALRRQGVTVSKVKIRSSAAAAPSPKRTSRCSRARWRP